tara:strand:- start:571 stop:918 length:348 start_codon:yes stop_codon:yes gene_type:complete
MANKITVSIDTDKAKELLVKDSYTNKEGKKVEVQRLKFELIEMKKESQKVVYDHAQFQLIKTHFAVKPQTKEERKANAETVFCGEGVTQVWNEDSGAQSSPAPSKPMPQDDDLPF